MDVKTWNVSLSLDQTIVTLVKNTHPFTVNIFLPYFPTQNRNVLMNY